MSARTVVVTVGLAGICEIRPPTVRTSDLPNIASHRDQSCPTS